MRVTYIEIACLNKSSSVTPFGTARHQFIKKKTSNLYDGDTHGPLFLSESKRGKLVIHTPKVYTFQLDHVLVLRASRFTLTPNAPYLS